MTKRHKFCPINHDMMDECSSCNGMFIFDKFLESNSEESKKFIRDTTIKMAIQEPELYKEMCNEIK